jgi:hypothetical protein
MIHGNQAAPDAFDDEPLLWAKIEPGDEYHTNYVPDLA